LVDLDTLTCKIDYYPDLYNLQLKNISMKRTIIGLFLALLVFSGQAQGLNKVIVEKYYVSDANDSAISGGTLPIGSVTWRIYVDMKPGYVFQTATGDKNHSLIFSTSTTFFNDANGDYNPNGLTTTTAKTGTVMLDSWLSTGASSKNFWGVLKSDDTLAGNFVNSDGALINYDPSTGIPLTTKDGMFSKGAVPAFGQLGIDQSALDVLGDGSVSGSLFSISNGAWYILGGDSGPSVHNRILIAQLTTDGSFHYELNFQLGKNLGGGQSLTEKYASTNPQSDELSGAQYALSGDLLPNAAILKVGLTAPLDGSAAIEGDIVTLSANAVETLGGIAKVEFYVDDAKVGQSISAPFSYDWTSATGSPVIYAIAIDTVGNHRQSAPISITVNANMAPTVSITSPADNAQLVTGNSYQVTADASDVDGTVASVEFFVDGNSIGKITSSPFQVNYDAASGAHVLTAVAIDNKGSQTTSASVNVDVATGINKIAANAFSFSVYPSPATDLITLDLSSSAIGKNMSYKIITLEGQTIVEKLLAASTETINVSSFAKGIYSIVIIIDGRISTQRFIKL
jgi:hypothetical protein